jgi:hypothetical protein
MLENVDQAICVVCVRETVIVTVIVQVIWCAYHEMDMKLFKDAQEKEEIEMYMEKIFVLKVKFQHLLPLHLLLQLLTH